jgi:signal transduction histidine kinase
MGACIIYFQSMSMDRQEQRDFLLRACHDLRAALRAVRANAELMAKARESRDPQQIEQSMSFIVDGAKNADAIVDGLVKYALALRIEISPTPVSTGALLRAVLANMAPEINGSGAKITYAALPEVSCDPDRLMQMFENLLRNAIQQRGEAAPRIQVSAQENGGQWLFAVSDNGPGIEAKDLERIFRPFERLRSNQGGAGLGLAICREIVAGHGGRIWAESKAGIGTTFYFTL